MSSSPPSPQPSSQAVSRPPFSRPGGQAPWADVAPQARSQLTLDRVKLVFKGHQFGDSGSSPSHSTPETIRSISGAAVDGNPAAVLVGLFEEDGKVRVILTVRSHRLRSHRGEVAFPGGRLDPGETIDEGALREAYEEIGLEPSGLDIIGYLTSIPTVSSNTVMTPVVAVLEARPTLLANPDEVARIFDVALVDLMGEGIFREEWWALPGQPGISGRSGQEFPVWFFDVDGEVVWGATARVLTELLCLLVG